MFDEIMSIEEVEDAECMDIWVWDERCQDELGGNFLINDLVVHNSIPEAMENRDDESQSWQKRMDPEFLKILKETYGVIVYQEQLQALWQNIAGFTSPEAQEARKAVAKKWTHKLKDIEKKWIIGASKKIGEEQAKEHWQRQVTFGRYAFNKSHGVAYTLMAFKCLWFKAHFAPEFWAAVMSDCHPDKLIRYMGVARAEDWFATDITYSGNFKPEDRATKVTFGTLDINNLQTSFSVTGDRVNVGLTGIKGIGDTASAIFSGKGNYKSIDEFVSDDKRKSKTVLERFIKLGAFKHFENHENSQALWHYYVYTYSSMDRELKKEINEKLLRLDGWDNKAIDLERKRQTEEYKRIYPKRNKIPPKILKWEPKPNPTLDNFNKIFPEDYSLSDRLEFQLQFIGYYIENPMEMFRTTGRGTISHAVERAKEGRNAFLEGMVERFVLSKTKTDKDFGKLFITDGLSSTCVFLWQRELYMQDQNLLKSGEGVFLPVDYDVVKKMFCLSRNEQVIKLPKL